MGSVLGLAKASSRSLGTEGLRQILEKLTKKFNATCSVNKKIRNEINVFRKERTLYDHVFKNLESLILQEEKKVLTMLKKNNEVVVLINGAEENFVNIVETVKKFKSEDFLEVIREEKGRYDDKLRKASLYGKKSIVLNLKNPEKVEEADVASPMEKSENQSAKRQSTFRPSRMVPDGSAHHPRQTVTGSAATPRDNNELRILLIEKCVKEFKFITEENSIDVGMQLLEKVNHEKEERHQTILGLELEVG